MRNHLIYNFLRPSSHFSFTTYFGLPLKTPSVGGTQNYTILLHDNFNPLYALGFSITALNGFKIRRYA